MLICWRARPEGFGITHRLLRLARPVDRSARDADGPGHPATVFAELLPGRVARSVDVHETAINQIQERLPGNLVADHGVRERDQNEVAVRAFGEPFDGRTAGLEPATPLLGGEPAVVGDVVDSPRKGVEGGNRTALRPRQDPDPPREAPGLTPGDPKRLCIRARRLRRARQLLEHHAPERESRWRRSTCEDVVLGPLECLERGEPAARKERHRASGPPTQRAPERKTPAEEVAGPRRLEPCQRPEALRARAGELVLCDREAPEILLRQVDTAELEVSGRVLEEVHELKTRTDRVAHLHECGLVQAPVDAEHEATHGIGRVGAVLPNLVPCLIAGFTLVDPVRLDQSPARLEWQRSGLDRRVQAPHHLCLGWAGELPLELVEEHQPVARGLVAERVDEPREPVDRPEVRPRPRRGEE